MDEPAIGVLLSEHIHPNTETVLDDIFNNTINGRRTRRRYKRFDART